MGTKIRKRGYGWRPDLPDHRDFLFGPVASASAAPSPEKVDLRPLCSKVEDQKQLGSCTAHALVGALEFLERKDGLKSINLSRLFVYFNERLMENTVESDSGAAIRTGIKVLAKQGVCLERKWPYEIARFIKTPSAAAYDQGAEHQITSYHRILDLVAMRRCLADGFPFVFGFSVYDGFESEFVARTGELQMPAAGESLLGGHAVLAVGYDDSTRRFIVRNSWGSRWGLKGYFTMPYAYLTDRNLSDDFWMIRRGENV
jgi:C1A family cysteine protease